MIGDCGHDLTGAQRRWCSADCQKTAARAARLRAHFDLTPADYDLILAVQGGVCAVCGKAPGDKFFPIDHDHRTKYVRGVICGFCNLRIVAKHTDPRLLRRAAEYLADPPARRALGRDVVAPGRPRKRRRPRRKKAA